MSSFLNFLKPPKHLEEIQDQTKVKNMYKYWRVRIFYSMFIGYALYYFTRKSFVFAIPALTVELGLDKGHIGWLGTIFSVTYAVSKFVSGVQQDRSNPRYFMALGLIVTGLLNIAFGLSSTFLIFAVIWGLNGWFQGFGWPGCARLLVHWYSHSERGSWWSCWNISHNMGAFIIPWIVGLFVQYYSWRFGFFVPGLICIFGGLFIINRLRDTPQTLGLPPVEKFNNDYPPSYNPEEHEKELTAKEILFDYVLNNKFLWLLVSSYFFLYIVRTGINDWSPLFLYENKNYTYLGANGNASIFEIGGVFGTLAAGWGSDWLFKAKRGPVNVIFLVGVCLSVFLFWAVPAGYPFFDSVALFSLGFFIFGPQMLVGVAAVELSIKKAAATAAGFAGYVAYMGAAVAGFPLGKITQAFGWNGFFWFLSVCSITSIAFMLPLWNVVSVQHRQQQLKKINAG